MTEPDNEEVGIEVESPEEPLQGPDGTADFIGGRWEFAAHWLGKLGIEDPTGAVVTFGENCAISILHPVSGEWLTPEQIAKRASRPASVREMH